MIHSCFYLISVSAAGVSETPNPPVNAMGKTHNYFNLILRYYIFLVVLNYEVMTSFLIFKAAMQGTFKPVVVYKPSPTGESASLAV